MKQVTRKSVINLEFVTWNLKLKLINMKTDIEIANSIEIKPIYEIADKLGIDRDLLEPYGRYKAKLPLSLIDKSKIDGKKLILVSAISPTPAGG